MSPVLSKATPVLDGSAAGFRRAAGDLGEAIAVLSGGLPPDQWTRSRLAQALREIQSFLVAEAHEQDGRAAVSEDLLLRAAVASMMTHPVSVAMPVALVTEAGHGR